MFAAFVFYKQIVSGIAMSLFQQAISGNVLTRPTET
jgi:hypothetical protein